MKSGACGRADLVWALIRDDPARLEAMAGLLDYEAVGDEVGPVRAETGLHIQTFPATVTISAPQLERRPLAEVPFWYQEGYTVLSNEPPPEPDVSLAPEQWNGQTGKPAHYRYLAPWRELHPRLRTAMSEEREGAILDVDAIVRQLGQGRLLERLPRRRHRGWGARLQIIEDRSERLIPYWQDQALVRDKLTRLFPRYALEYALFRDGLAAPRLLKIGEPARPYRLPPPDSLVLVLGDLGVLAADGGAASRVWRRIGQQLQRSRCRALALLPCDTAARQQGLSRYYQLQRWERPSAVERSASETLRKRADHLLTLVSPAVRIEPGLLRTVRFALGANRADAAVESAVWQHPDLIGTASEAATLDPKAARRRRLAFAREPSTVQQQVLKCLKNWRQDLPCEIWFEEVRSLEPAARKALPNLKDWEVAQQFFLQLSQQARGIATDSPAPGALTWFQRCEGRLPQSAWQDGAVGIALQQLSSQLHRDDPDYQRPPGIIPANIAAGDAFLGTVAVHQRGGELLFSHAESDSATAGSPLGRLQSRNGLIRIQEAHDEMPPWASAWGEDEYGPWAEFEFKGVRQRLRWIPPGKFLIGSPEDEPERLKDEGPQQQVALNQGLWLFDTACTQALWQAVMGENPSSFQGADRPVEKVSWNDCQEFLTRLNREIPGLQLILPSEAQWEYACRAGTSTPFSFGETISPEQVNYNGNYPYTNGEKGRDRGETVPVGSLPVNPWGLYEMHGNVDEWCHDGLRSYGAEPIADPMGPLEVGALRVIRGGAWYYEARGCRSANRHAIVPGYRDDSLGFRCARVQDSAEPDPPGAGRPAEQGRTRVAGLGGARTIQLNPQRPTARVTIPPAPRLIVQSDSEQLRFERLTKPTWANVFGRDSYGLWTDIEIDAEAPAPVIQRLRWIPPGRFRMGSPASEHGGLAKADDEREWFLREGPQHEVTLTRGYWLFDTPVTQALWEFLMGGNPSRFQSPDRPVEKVSWDDCQTFLEKINTRIPDLGLSLPTEAQWEYACRADSEGATYTGEFEILGESNAPALDPIAWYGGNSGVDFELSEGENSSSWPEKQYDHQRAGTHPVGKKQPNAWGLYDMLGNVWEWCTDGLRDYAAEPIQDPAGPDEDGARRVLRGGAWYSEARSCRSADRYAHDPGYRYYDLGFRCARVQPEPGGQAKASGQSKPRMRRRDRGEPE